MTNKIFWRDRVADYTMTPGYYEMMDAIKDSNLPDEYKFAILAKMADYDSRMDEMENAIRETILQELYNAKEGMRISDLAKSSLLLSDFPIQKITGIMRSLIWAKLVCRDEILTGRKITVAPNKEIEEKQVIFRINFEK